MKYGIGIDTGGTFTDSVIVDFVSRRIISKAKALTMRQDLRIGILNSLSALNTALFSEVKLVSLSTTLATNSIVEGKGQRVGLMIAVPDEATFRMPADIPADEVAVIRGAYDRSGNQTVPLDLNAGRSAIQRMTGRVDAFAVSGYFGIYNAGHELQLKDLIAAQCGCPVVCGHELTGAVGMVERAVTAALNAKLLPVIADLLDAVVHILKEKHIDAPLMIVRGDGSLISEKAARSRPVETILSGPAASMIGASWLTGLNDAIVVDMGGTTTDIGILAGAMPAVCDHGAVVGGWQTRIRSIDMWTAGLGGDSKISIVSADNILIGPRRVEPLSLAATKHAAFKTSMEQLREIEGTQLKDFDLDYFTLLKMPMSPLEKHERRMLEALNGQVLHRTEIEALCGPWINVTRFVALGFVAELSFTPTDLLHAMGVLNLWDRHVCESAIQFYAKKTGLNREELLKLLFDTIVQKLKLNIVARSLISDGVEFQSRESTEFLEDLLRLDSGGATSIQFKLERPLVAVGAPVASYFPAVAGQLGAKLVIPDHAEVANAAGAVTGRVIASAQVFVRPVRPIGFAVIPADGNAIFDSLKEAATHAEELARSMAEIRAEELGAQNIDTSIKIEEVTAPLAGGWGKTIFMELKIMAIAIGEPYV